MIRRRTCFTNTIFIATCLTLGCSSSGVLGCSGSSSGGGEEIRTIDSNLPAVYQITSYQGSENGCEEVADVPFAPSYLALYAFRPLSAPDETRLGGIFCSGVDECRALADFGGEPSRGYSFLVGDDETGWTGYAILSNESAGDTSQCRAEVQVHELSVSGEDELGIETRTVDTIYDATVLETSGSCRNAAAIASINDDLPCRAIILLEATREAEL